MIDVYDYKTKEKLGRFLSIETVNQEVKIWYLCEDGMIMKSARREDIYMEERSDSGPAFC